MSETVQRKTSENLFVAQGRVKVEGKRGEPGEYSNVLDGYRSYTYNFTLAVLTPEQIKNFKPFNDKPDKNLLDFIILQSSGKTENQFKSDNAGPITVKRAIEIDDAGVPFTQPPLYTDKDSKLGKTLVEQFNKKSPGRFDMFINNVEIATTGAFNSDLQTSLATGINFSVFEPLSNNGFLEALYTGALAAGYNDYLSAAYLFKISFKGYPDSGPPGSLPEPEEVPNATRFFTIRFRDISVEVTQTGTRYDCVAFPWHEYNYGSANVLKAVVKIEGKQKVKDVLKSFEDAINEQTRKIEKAGRPVGNYPYDTYKILLADADGNIVENNEISETDIIDLWRSENVYSLPDNVDENGKSKKADKSPNKKQLEEDDPDYLKLIPNKASIHFKEGALVHECITAIIRDSGYISSIIKQINKKTKKIDPTGMMNYFIIYPYAEPKKFDPINNIQTYIYTYIIAPYKVHFTRIPRLQSVKWDSSNIQPLIAREYNYFYSGQNNDLLNFKINVNGLYREQPSGGMGTPFYVTSAGTLGKNGENNFVNNPTDESNLSKDQILTPGSRMDPTGGEVSNIGNAGVPVLDAYGVLARNLHRSVINSSVALVGVDFDIVGDPIFLVTPSPGKIRPKPLSNSAYFLSNGEANHLKHELMIRLTFRNPIDIDEEGYYEFSEDQIPYGGVFRIAKISHSFRDGVFTQKIEALRLLGQILDQPVKPTPLEAKTSQKPNPLAKAVQDQTPGQGASIRARKSNLIAQLQKITTGITSLPFALTSGLNYALTEGFSSLTSPLKDAADQLNQNINRVRSSVAEVTARVTSVTQGLNYQIAQAGEKLGINTSNLRTASPIALAGILKLSKAIPSGVNLKDAEKLGVNTDFPLIKLPNLPPLQPKTTAPPAEQNTKDLENIIKLGGVKSLASAFGVKSLDKIPASILPTDLANTLTREASKASISNPLSKLNNKLPLEDFNKLADKTLANLNRLSPSVEVNITIANQTTSRELQNSVTSKLGSRVESPLTKFIDTNNT